MGKGRDEVGEGIGGEEKREEKVNLGCKINENFN